MQSGKALAVTLAGVSSTYQTPSHPTITSELDLDTLSDTNAKKRLMKYRDIKRNCTKMGETLAKRRKDGEELIVETDTRASQQNG